MRHKDFGSPASQDEPVTFSIYGQMFKCRKSIQGRTLVEFIARSSNESEPGESATAILDFFSKVIDPVDVDRFVEMTGSDDYVIPLDTLGSIMEWLVEQYASRPTKPSSPSSPGESITGPMPTAVPSYPEPLSGP